MVMYIPFMISNFYRDFWSQFLSSMVLGIGGATLWSSSCTYVNDISALYSSQVDESIDVVTTRFFGIFFTIFQNSQIWSNLVAYCILNPDSSENLEMRLVPFDKNLSLSGCISKNNAVSCGARFCGELTHQLSEIAEDKIYLLLSVYLVFSVLAAAVVAIFLDPINRSDKDFDHDSNIMFSKLIATVQHLRKPYQILLVPITIFMGVEQAFIFGDFSQVRQILKLLVLSA